MAKQDCFAIILLVLESFLESALMIDSHASDSDEKARTLTPPLRLKDLSEPISLHGLAAANFNRAVPRAV